MITGIYQWIKNIAFYMILITAVMNVIPNNNYKKYINLFTGIVMIILVISPISKLLGASTRLDSNFIKNIYNQEIINLKVDAYQISDTSSSKLLEEYKNEISNQIEEIVNKEGYFVVKSKIVMNEDRESDNYGNLEGIEVVLSTQEKKNQKILVDKIQIGQKQFENPEEISVKNVIDDFYNVGLDNINVSIQR
ncbi:MAG: stage III sporulation protein AF [Candidatus Galacturonibacter soehngenii]|nr:stage III sporulation protein AF [Candidatus Galacturonibacter soehngenii]